jgi:ABC-type sugar transport system ATPase subunit
VPTTLEFRELHKSFGAVRALRGVSFEVREGETHACVGENGAGKSTLLKILAGIVGADRGEIRWRGEPLRVTSPRDALLAGIGMVYQERLFFPNLSVAANIFAGHEIADRIGRLDERAMRTRAAVLLDRLHVPVSPDVAMERLSPAHVQLVQVARALAFDCRVLVLDEPTTALTDREAGHLFDVLAALRARGVTILFVSHRLPEVFRLCDRITVLRDGQYVATFDTCETTVDQVVRAMVGSTLSLPFATRGSWRASPKSRILTVPSDVTKTFSGFRSRWTMPRACAAARPRAICRAKPMPFRIGIASAASRARSVSPDRSSVTA